MTDGLTLLTNMISPKKYIVIYSHGFGVRKDDRGLLTGIAQALPEVASVLFDYFDVDEANKTLTTCPPSVQVEKLNRVIREAKESHPEAIIDLIAHSQGTVIAALAQPEGIRKTLFLAPVFDMSIERTLKRYGSRPDAEIHLEGISKLPALDGLTRIVPAAYWEERRTLQPFKEYNVFAEKTELAIIEAGQDEILQKVDLGALSPKVKVTTIDGNHNFNGLAREHLIEKIRDYLLKTKI